MSSNKPPWVSIEYGSIGDEDGDGNVDVHVEGLKLYGRPVGPKLLRFTLPFSIAVKGATYLAGAVFGK